MNLKSILTGTVGNQYAVGSFSPRVTQLIRPVLQAAQNTQSPVIVQISQKELMLYEVSVGAFSKTYFKLLKQLDISVPTTLHLDHTKEFGIIKDAIAAGFESVMIDASEKSFEENVDMTRRVVEHAKHYNVSVEAELGRIGTTDFVETDNDEEFLTIPEQAQTFVALTGVDALAVSVGTAHGVYHKRQPRIDLERIKAIRQLTPVFLVLHGASGVPSDMLAQALKLEGGGPSKVNIATDIELAFLDAINRDERLTDKACDSLDQALLSRGQQAAMALVENKMRHYLFSAKKAPIATPGV